MIANHTISGRKILMEITMSRYLARAGKKGDYNGGHAVESRPYREGNPRAQHCDNQCLAPALCRARAGGFVDRHKTFTACRKVSHQAVISNRD